MLNLECVLGKQPKGTLQHTQYLSKTRLFRAFTLVNTYFYEHTSFCSLAVLLRSVCLLILKVTHTYLGLYFSYLEAPLGLPLLEYIVVSVPLFSQTYFHTARLHCSAILFILNLAWPNLNL